MRLIKSIPAIFDGVVDRLMMVVGALLAFAALSIFIDVSLRFLRVGSLTWVQEVTTYILLWSAFLGAAWLLRKDRHIVMDAVIERLRPRVQDRLNVVTSILGTILFLVITYYSAQTTWDAFQKGTLLVRTIVMPPKAPIMVIIPIGSFLLFIQYIKRSYKYLGRWRAPAE